MAKLVKQSHPVLHQIADEVPVSDITAPKIQKVIKDMRKALLDYNVEGFDGVAIAAPQIGVPLRIFLVYNGEKNPEEKEKGLLPNLVAINPRLVKLSKKKHLVGEGCLSVGEHYGAVKRAVQTTLRAYDENGKAYERGASGLLAQIFQHEVDHLDGILFVDKAEKVWHKDDEEAQQLSEAQHDET